MQIENWINELTWHPTRRWAKRRLAEIDKIIIHQTLSVASIEAINHYHTTPGVQNHISQQGAPHICYHYLIDCADTHGADGRVVNANTPDDVVWHTRGQNRTGIGIALCGNFNGEGYDDGRPGPTESQMDSLEQLVPILQRNYNIPNTKVYGHYHYGKPACPGSMVREWIEKYRLPSVNEIGDITCRDKAAELVRHLKEKINNPNDRIKFYQKALNKLGYPVGSADGILGVRTTSGIRRFQARMGLNVDGVMGPVSTSRLFEELLKTGNDMKPGQLKKIISRKSDTIEISGGH